MTDEQKEELKRILCIFGSGCAEAGPASIRPRSNPADCEDCLNAVVGVIERQVFNKPKQEAAMLKLWHKIWTCRRKGHFAIPVSRHGSQCVRCGHIHIDGYNG